MSRAESAAQRNRTVWVRDGSGGPGRRAVSHSLIWWIRKGDKCRISATGAIAKVTKVETQDSVLVRERWQNHERQFYRNEIEPMGRVMALPALGDKRGEP